MGEIQVFRDCEGELNPYEFSFLWVLNNEATANLQVVGTRTCRFVS